MRIDPNATGRRSRSESRRRDRAKSDKGSRKSEGENSLALSYGTDKPKKAGILSNRAS